MASRECPPFRDQPVFVKPDENSFSWPFSNRRRSAPSKGRHCRSTLSLAVLDGHSLGIYTVILVSLLSFSAEMKVPPKAISEGRLEHVLSVHTFTTELRSTVLKKLP